MARGGAHFSWDEEHRYTLTRYWSEGDRLVNFIGLNPSTATATEDDPTIRRCMGFAKSWGYDGLVMTNLFAYRSTDPRMLKRVGDPVGPDNDRHLREQGKGAALVVAAWGAQPSHENFRIRDVLQVLWDVDLYCLKLTKNGYPWHPLYVPTSTQPLLFRKGEC